MEHKLPESQLIEILRRKASERSDVVFDYIGKLEELRSRVGGEVRFINELFPEYTPHDEEYHLSRLFHVAVTLIEPERLENMNATELFVLACGLYGHDWGMAVSAVERDYIVTGTLSNGLSHPDFALLHDEHQTFERFVRERGLEINDIRANGIDDEDWRDYVRKTHAYRSGERIRDFFKNVDSGIGDAAGRVCEGHWLNIEDIQDFHRYPSNFAVLRENLNLAALAIYVRLVDLLDIGHDRTPYVIWKFVAPRNRYSKMEWQKHRALQPITCPRYLHGRIVLVDGSTDDHEVYASLEDLRLYCEKQLRECTDVLAQLGDPRHLLDLYHIEWRVVARGFDPVLVRFEFDRERVFEILSNEIYQGDPYVFLRELLQNSIDAIRMRREILEERGGIKLEAFGLIEVKVEHGDHGDAKITWTDDGIGMDAYVVRNYLAVAGRSYYRSEEFERQGLKLDPISRFGVGILSCFMVANVVEIETCKDPYATSAVGALRIKIPSMTRNFRIERSAPLDFGIGTRVNVFVEGQLLDEAIRPLKVTEYLKQIAGFVEFPILISEKSSNTLLLHPKSMIDPNHDRRFSNYAGIETHRLALGYPWSDVIVPQDIKAAQAECVERGFDLANDLGLSTCEGRITYLEIRNKDKWIDPDYEYDYGAGLILSEGDLKDGAHIRWIREWGDYFTSAEDKPGLARSADAAPSYAVYRDGVLVPDAALPIDYLRTRGRREGLPLARMVANLTKADSTSIDLARVQLKSDGAHWFDAIEKALARELIEAFRRELGELDGKETLLRLGLFMITYNVDPMLLFASSEGQLPIGILTDEGTFTVQKWRDWADKEIALCPEPLEGEIGKLIDATVLDKPYKGYIRKWRGQSSVIHHSGGSSELRIDKGLSLTHDVLRDSYSLARVVQLQPPDDRLPPLIQEIWQRKGLADPRSIESIASDATVDPIAISSDDRSKLVRASKLYWDQDFVEIPANGAPPFRVGQSLINLSHPVGKLLFQSSAWLVLNANSKSADLNRGLIKDAATQLVPEFHQKVDARRISAAAQKLCDVATRIGLTGISPKQLKINPKDLWYQPTVGFARLAQRCKGTFGQPLD